MKTTKNSSTLPKGDKKIDDSSMKKIKGGFTRIRSNKIVKDTAAGRKTL